MQKPIRLLPLILLISSLFSLPLRAEKSSVPVSFREYTVDDGLISNRIYAMLQDDQGFVWIGTNSGVARFDGQRFRSYTKQDESGLTDNEVRDLLLDHQGRIWVTLANGVDIYDPQTDRFHHFEKRTEQGEGIESRAIDLMQDRDGEIWISTMKQGVFRYSPQRDCLRCYRYEEGNENSLAQDYVSTLGESSDGWIWFGTYSEGLCALDKDREAFVRYRADGGPHSLTDNSVNAIVEDSYGDLWLGLVNHGIDRLERSTGRFSSIKVEGQDDRLHHIHTLGEVALGELLVSSDAGATLYRITEEGLSPKRDSKNRFSTSQSRIIYSYLKDREGNLWLGSYFDGIEFYPSFNNFTYYRTSSEQQPDRGKEVLAICQRSDQTYWVATPSNGIQIFDAEDGTISPFSNPLNDSSVASIHSMLVADGRLWVAAYQQGIWAIDPKSGRAKNYLIDECPATARVFSLHRSSNGRIYAGTAHGLYYYNLKKDRFEMLVHSTLVSDIAEDQNGQLWVATSTQGLYRYNPKTGESRSWQHDPLDENTPSSNSISCLVVDHKNCLWIGTVSDGLCSWSEQTGFVRYDHLALPSHQIAEIICEEETLWISTERGLASLNPDTGELKVFLQSDGLINPLFTPKSGCRSKSGDILLGTADGICRFNPSEMLFSEEIPPVVITGLMIDDKRVLPGEGSVLSKPIEQTREVSLSHRQSFVGLQFSVPSYISPENIRFRFRLDEPGREDRWHLADRSLHSATVYYNLHSGEHIFRVQASTGDGRWSSGETSLKIRVHPHFLRSRVAIVIYCLVILAVLLLLVRYFLLRTHKDYTERISRLEGEKEQEIYDLKINFFADMAHEIRTPLSLIVGPLEQMRKSPEIQQRYGEYFSIIEKNKQRLVTLVNQMLEYRRIDQSGYVLRYRCCPVRQLIEEVVALFHYQVGEKGLEVQIHCPEELTQISDPEALTKVLSNLLGNAIKYAERKILISATKSDEGLLLEVVDDGRGISGSDQQKIFDLFYRVPVTAGNHPEGMGVGLHLSKLLVEQLGGVISVENSDSVLEEQFGRVGSRFRIFLPTPDPSLQGADAKPMEASDAVEEPASEESSHEEAASRRILVVDDNPDICNFLSQILSTEYQVTSARSGEEAEVLLRSQDFDLVISDIMMPGISGVELCRRIKNDIQVSHVPVILLTARTDVKTKIESLDCGVDAYIEKPFSTDYLKAQVANLFRKYEGMKTVYASTPMSEVRAVTHSELDKEFIEQSREVIIANMSNPDLSVDFLAKEMGMSRTSIFKKLKAITGMTPNDFMKFIRLNEACRLLVEGKYRITEIGFITGFSSSSYFAKCFAKQFGTLPTEFVRNLGQEAEE